MRNRLELVLIAVLLPFMPAVAAQSPRLDNACVEPFATSSGYVLTPQCPPRPLAALFDVDRYNLELLPPLGDPSRRQGLRIYERRIPGTEIVVTTSPLRNQWMYSPGQTYGAGGTQFPLSPREAASDFVFGVRVPF